MTGPAVRPLLRRSLLLVPALALVASGCTNTQGTEGKQYVGADFQVAEIAPADRGAPVDSKGESLDGTDIIDTADYRGQVLVVNVWWSGCGPCYKELPLLVQATSSLGTDVSLIGMNIRDTKANGAAFERDLGVDFPSIYSPGGQNLLDFGNQINPRSIPSTAVLDRQGRLAALLSGPIPTAQTLISLVDTVVGETGG